ncbi:MAG: nuclear transport factor 2 family protein [Aureispira sp.]|nr:nuclear transport factor 2 family protein [Aureispira sp.]
MPDGLWQIIQIADTRRHKNCINEGNTKKTEDRINTVMDSWHKAAAEADEDVFFDGLMTKDAIYLGTDASERWLRDELKEWSKVHFDKESAWSFTANWRNVYLSNNQRMAWFEESLDTWMGECRGSGVLELINGEWKIKHYNLSIMVPNDIVKDFMDLVKNGPKTKEEEEPKTGKKKRKKKKSKKKK